MDKQEIYRETQKFRQWWLWIMIMGVNGFILWGVYKQILSGQPAVKGSLSDLSLIILLIILLSIDVLFFSIRLETVVSREGIYVKLFPFHIKFQFYPWNTITKCYVRSYKPILEFGGWGLRYGFFGRGKAYSISGKTGLQIEFENHKKLLIGTCKGDELREALLKAGHWQP